MAQTLQLPSNASEYPVFKGADGTLYWLNDDGTYLVLCPGTSSPLGFADVKPDTVMKSSLRPDNDSALQYLVATAEPWRVHTQ